MQFTVKLYCFLLLCTAAAAVAVDSTEGSDEVRCLADELAGLEGRDCP
ncbi:uncharacterized protein ARMOST_08386 [Armillaria ostoyae]|uniref:Uncharacterized protein n=1 Tax=Armillaria ostoyae TaxID=47428 RepID=A0A284R8J6_ARMOS|nr:uncharacterized protein ARMOST_08386 [Armillaria ostoyae]